MNKTNPIGVRFRADLLEKLKNDHGIESPQKALVFYERFFVTHSGYVRDVKYPLRDDLDLTPAAKKEVKNIKIKDLPKTEGVLKPQGQPKVKFEAAISETAQKAIREQIAAIRAEKIPPERNTPMGKKAWQIDQQKRIQELQNKLK